MPKLSLFNDIFREPWMIEPLTAAAQKQVLHGLLMGLEFQPEVKEESTIIGHKQNGRIPQGKGINVVNLEGVMLRDDGPCGMEGTRTIGSKLLDADRKDGIIGHIIRIDSGGGASNSVIDLAEAIQACEKPVVAFVDGYMCSAAMYVGSYCGHIIAFREDNKVGCIGTMIQLEDYPRQVRDGDGMMHIRIYADGAEEKNDEYETALEEDFKLMKERVLNPHNERFKADIKANRPKVREDQLKGRTYEAKDAVGTLIDAIGSFDTAVAKVIEMSNHNITAMKGYENLQSLDSCHDLQMVDGCSSLNEEQLGEVDAAIGEGRKAKASKEADAKTIAEQANTIKQLTQERDELKSKTDQLEVKDKKIAELTTERDTLKEETAKKDARIAELETALDQDPDNNDGDAAMQAMHNGNPANDDNWKEATDQEAAEYCHKVLNGEL